MGRDEIAYVLVRAEPDADVQRVKARLMLDVPGVEVLTSAEFAERTVRYWMLETGAGLTVGLAAFLGLVISIVVTTQTLVSVTRDNRSHYATLLGLGSSSGELARGVMLQAVTLTLFGDAGGLILLTGAIRATRDGSVPIEMTPTVLGVFVVATFVFGILAALTSVRSVLRIDPADAFRGI
jgi:putative ABC transport system permease protein